MHASLTKVFWHWIQSSVTNDEVQEIMMIWEDRVEFNTSEAYRKADSYFQNMNFVFFKNTEAFRVCTQFHGRKLRMSILYHVYTYYLNFHSHYRL